MFVVSDFSSLNESEGGILFISKKIRTRRYRTKRKSPPRGSALQGKDGRGLSEMTPDPTPPEVKHYKEKTSREPSRTPSWRRAGI